MTSKRYVQGFHTGGVGNSCMYCPHQRMTLTVMMLISMMSHRHNYPVKGKCSLHQNEISESLFFTHNETLDCNDPLGLTIIREPLPPTTTKVYKLI